jgi:hypothetical protein
MPLRKFNLEDTIEDLENSEDEVFELHYLADTKFLLFIQKRT